MILRLRRQYFRHSRILGATLTRPSRRVSIGRCAPHISVDAPRSAKSRRIDRMMHEEAADAIREGRYYYADAGAPTIRAVSTLRISRELFRYARMLHSQRDDYHMALVIFSLAITPVSLGPEKCRLKRYIFSAYVADTHISFLLHYL